MNYYAVCTKIFLNTGYFTSDEPGGIENAYPQYISKVNVAVLNIVLFYE
jgi:hypothetical protein